MAIRCGIMNLEKLIKNRTKEIEKIEDAGFEVLQGFGTYVVYAKDNYRILYDPRIDRIVINYEIKRLSVRKSEHEKAK